MAITYTIPSIPTSRAFPAGDDYDELGSSTLGSAKSLASNKVYHVDTVATLRAIDTVFLSVQNGATCLTHGQTTKGDGNGLLYYYDTSSTASDDGLTVIKPTTVTGAGRWLKVFGGSSAPAQQVFTIGLTAIDKCVPNASTTLASFRAPFDLVINKVPTFACKVGVTSSAGVQFLIHSGGDVTATYPKIDQYSDTSVGGSQPGSLNPTWVNIPANRVIEVTVYPNTEVDARGFSANIFYLPA